MDQEVRRQVTVHTASTVPLVQTSQGRHPFSITINYASIYQPLAHLFGHGIFWGSGLDGAQAAHEHGECRRDDDVDVHRHGHEQRGHGCERQDQVPSEAGGLWHLILRDANLCHLDGLSRVHPPRREERRHCDVGLRLNDQRLSPLKYDSIRAPLRVQVLCVARRLLRPKTSMRIDFAVRPSGAVGRDLIAGGMTSYTEFYGRHQPNRYCAPLLERLLSKLSVVSR